MVLMINHSKALRITEPFLIYDENRKRLYNKNTKDDEGVDGDSATFIIDVEGRPRQIKGTVEGYTCGNNVRIRGIDTMFENVKEKYIEHISSIELVDIEN